MKEKLNQYKVMLTEKWHAKSQRDKGLILSAILIVLVIVIGGSFLATRTTMVPLYSNLSLQEAGQIKAELDTRGIRNEVSDAGTTIRVPEEMADSLLVELAAQGIPQSGGIDYSFFSQNSSWGVTDNEFNIMKLDAMQTELANLITNISGIEQANVMINMPQQRIFVSDDEDQASASIVLHIAPGHRFDPEQVNALYHLVSKSVPNLPVENIGILDQHFNYYDLDNGRGLGSSDVYASQQAIKQDIELDIQRRVQQMLGIMIGPDKVVTSVTADIDFTQENRIEHIVDTVTDDIEGLPVSVERIHETYTGQNPVDGVVGTGEGGISGYESEVPGQGDYELIQESVNYEFNRIQREIVESPYKIRDLGIQVAVDSRKGTLNEDGEYELLTDLEQENVENSIESILNSIIETTIDKTYRNEADTENTQNSSIVFQEFTGLEEIEPQAPFRIPLLVMIAGGVLLLIILILFVVLLTRKRHYPEEEFAYTAEATDLQTEIPELDDIEESDQMIKRKQLEKMAKEKPDDFAKLLRSWISED